MGLAILPPRLKAELAEVAKYLLGQPNEIKAYHQAWADEIKAKHPELTPANASEIVKAEVGQVFKRVLEDAGVYKRTKAGQAGFMRFAHYVGLVGD